MKKKTNKTEQALAYGWLALAGVYVGGAVYEYVKTIFEERSKRSRIEAWKQAELKRTVLAKKMVLERLDDGAYRKTGYTGAMKDFDFVRDVMKDIDNIDKQ